MGIKGLLPFVEKACRPGHVDEFVRKRVAIDVSCLLHRGVFGCVESIAQGLKTDFCIKYVEKYLKSFLHFKCEIYLVFDGQRLEAKQFVNDERKEKRDSIKRIGEELMSVGLENEAYKVFRQGIGVPKEIQDDSIKHFTAMKTVKVIVSPYEADAQLAFMINNNIVDVVVTEDSDLIAFGAPKIIFKLKENGACLVFDQSKLPRCICAPLAKNFNIQTFRRMCIMSGCDYLPSGLNGVGLKKAEAIFSKTSITDVNTLLRRIPLYLNNRSIRITPEFIQSFIQAENTFMYQIVYDPVLECQRPINFYPDTTQDDYVNFSQNMLDIANNYSYAGRLCSPSDAVLLSKGISSSNLEPNRDLENECNRAKAVLRTSYSMNIQVKSQSPNIPTHTSSPRPTSQPLLPLKNSPLALNYNVKRARSSGMFSPKVTKRRITIDDKGAVTFNETESPDSSKASQNVTKDAKIDLSRVNSKKIVNPSLSVAYTKINITNVKMNRRFVSPVIRRPIVPDSIGKPSTRPAFL